MALKRPTPVGAVRRLKDSRKPVSTKSSRETARTRDLEKVEGKRALDSRKTVKPRTLTESERKRALDSREASLERRWQRLFKEKRALRDGAFEITEESFRALVKEALLEALQEMGAVVETEEEQPATEEALEEEKAEKEDFENEPGDEGKEFEDFEDEPEDEPEEEPEEELEGEAEDDVGLTELLKDPRKKEALKELLDRRPRKIKGKDNAAALFTNRYDIERPAAVEETPKIRNRYE